MKDIIVKANAGTLTNFEVLDLLNSRGASITTSEYKVYDYLMETPACVQTLEIITNFSDQCQGFKLAKAEILNIINIRPSFTFVPSTEPPSTVELTPILEEHPERGKIDERCILALVEALLPLPPRPIVEAGGENEEEGTEEGEQS
ncbi:uncharacterized protein LOC108823737 [Raphanus sativus]|uniref:Uncharacterized protein LOC108823737 n=1 Tax=Raphanus sativus TaxID=3726 RepID=A0A6J0KZB1_RAPSA|nr:uncharacterized protein LOC108823737 [Raphanus sativus]